MQFHLNGFRAGDPAIAEPLDLARRGADGVREVDVLLVGCGPAGLTLAAQLASLPGIDVAIVEQKAGPLTIGQADGIACRSMEMFEAFGFAERVLKEACWVNETAFWNADPVRPEHIVRGRCIRDTEDDLSEMPHVILNQARVHDFFLELMANSPSRLAPDYARRLLSLDIDAARHERDAAASHPVTARLECLDDARRGATETLRARYVVGCDGARSTVREALGGVLRGDSANQAWGVMDVLAVSDFPDLRRKAVVHSASHGSVLIIPREGGYMVRMYIELDKLAPSERVAHRKLTPEHLIAAAQRILEPYTLAVKELAWWSVYEIGQRLCDSFDNAAAPGMAAHPRAFIVGDACHTHSPKAGQGMNVSMADSFNLGWKLSAVLQGRALPDILASYSDERRAVAQELIDFDREFARMFSTRPRQAAGEHAPAPDPALFQAYFIKHGRFTAGTAVRYAPSLIVARSEHQALARGQTTGMRFHSAPVVRVADARPLELGHVLKADGRWRVLIFADAAPVDDDASALGALCAFLEASARSPLIRHTPAGADIDSVIDVRAVYQASHRDIELAQLPPLLLPHKGRLGLCDYEKAYCVDGRGGRDIFELRGIDRARGCMVVVRPDQYVAHVLPLQAHEELAAFFARFMRRAGD
ncbi:MAG: FAD-dependent monooxygenase [Proteobacteria bacterium]|nr:FAD-dependent monooxygenase [Pseudomonadota bacterium]